MAVELVHRLATDNSPQVQEDPRQRDLPAVPSLNPDGQIMVTDWFNKNLGTPFETSQIPYLYHPYVGHDNNRDMYMFTQKESQLTAKLLWSDWFPSVWLDEHQMGSNGARIFVMPATDPINPNVHPLIYRWNGILGQSQAAALEAAGKEGIIYNSTYTNFWQGAMAWSGWWHNQIGLLTEVASARVAAPIDQQRAVAGSRGTACGGAAGGRGGGGGRGAALAAPLPPPTDINPAHRVPATVDGRPLDAARHRGLRADRDDGAARYGSGSARDAAAADLRGQPADRRGRARRATPAPSSSRSQTQHDPHEAVHLVEKLQMAGVEVYRAGACIRGGRQDVRRRHVRHADGAGVRAIRQGHPREADLPGGAALARPRRRSRRTTSAPGRSACSSASITSSSRHRSATAAHSRS